VAGYFQGWINFGGGQRKHARRLSGKFSAAGAWVGTMSLATMQAVRVYGLAQDFPW